MPLAVSVLSLYPILLPSQFPHPLPPAESPGMYTCLSGFIDQCESVEEAVRREVREEARVQVDAVHVLGTQPWPIGR